MPTRYITILTATLSLAVTLPASAEHFSVGSVPGNAPQGFSQVFSKHVLVLDGVHIYASSSTPNNKVLHAANILAQWLDNNEDGMPDDAAVFAKMESLHACVLMWPNEQAFENSGAEDIIPDSVWDTIAGQLLFGDETNPGYPGNGEFDWALEEVLHIVTTGGFARTYPNVFGEQHNTDIADAMDLVIAGGWYHYNDPTCDYGCKVAEFHYWALTSMLGAQDYPWRIPEIADEWELPTAALMQQNAATTVALLANPQWSQATVLPDGSYDPQSEPACPADYNGNGMVGASDLLALIAQWGQMNAIIDLDGDGMVTALDLLILLGQWGAC
jgi:hypothetical protein